MNGQSLAQIMFERAGQAAVRRHRPRILILYLNVYSRYALIIHIRRGSQVPHDSNSLAGIV